MKLKNLIWIMGMAICLISCDNDPFYYQDQSRIRLVGPEIWTLGTDSLSFSFANYSSAVADTTFEVEVIIMGEPSAVDRTADFSVNSSRTTASEEMFDFPSSVTIPAGEFSVILPVTLYRHKALKESELVLDILVVENQDFKIGVNSQNHLLLKYSDILSKPQNWNELEEFFGEFSLVKYQFIIEVLNTGSFDMDKLSWAQMKNHQITLAEALREYNTAHPGEPLTDENGNPVTF